MVNQSDQQRQLSQKISKTIGFKTESEFLVGQKIFSLTDRQIIHTVKYADDLVLQDMIDKLIEIGRCYGMEMNVEKTKVMRISRQQFPVKIMINQKQLENVESFKFG